MMEQVMGKMPERFARSGARSKPEYFKEGSKLDWPKPKATRASRKEVRACRNLQVRRATCASPTFLTHSDCRKLSRPQILSIDISSTSSGDCSSLTPHSGSQSKMLSTIHTFHFEFLKIRTKHSPLDMVLNSRCLPSIKLGFLNVHGQAPNSTRRGSLQPPFVTPCISLNVLLLLFSYVVVFSFFARLLFHSTSGSSPLPM